MHRTKQFRTRVLVPSALAVVILSGAVAPAAAVDGGTAAVTRRMEAVQQQIEGIESRAAAGPIDDLLASITKTLEGLLKSLGALLPGVKLPELPKLPKLPDIPALPGLEIPKLPVEIPKLPTIPEVPAVPEIPTVPEIPAVP